MSTAARTALHTSFLLLFYITACRNGMSGIATVNGQEISRAEYRLAVENRLLLTGKKELTSEEKKDIIGGLIARELLRQGAVNTGIKATDAEIGRRIEGVRTRMGGNGLEAWMKRQNISRDAFRSSIEREILVDKFREHLSQGISVSTEDMEAYYRANSGDFTVPPLYKVYILKTFGEDEAKDMLVRFRQQRENFDTWALVRSPEDIRLINRNARLTPENDFPEAMVTMMKTMKAGDIGGPVKAKAGYFLFRLLEKEPARQKQFTEVSAEIGHLVLEEKREKKIDTYVAAQKAGAVIAVALSN